jgi:hypothetical protein
MKTRLQLARGYADGTLTPEETQMAEQNPVVMREAARLTMEQQTEYDGGEHTDSPKIPKRRNIKHG